MRRSRGVPKLRQGVVGVRSSHLGRAHGGLGADRLREHASRFLVRAWLSRATDRIAMVVAIGRLSLRLCLCLGLSLSLSLGLSLSLSLGLGLSLRLRLRLNLGSLGLGCLGLGLNLSLCLRVRLKLVDATVPVCNLPRRSRGLRRRSTSGRWRTPLRCGRSPDTRSLVGLRVDILRLRSRGASLTRALKLALEQLQACLDVNIGRVQIGSSSVRIQGVGNLVVARFIL